VAEMGFVDMPINKLLDGAGFNAATMKVLSGTFDNILRDLDLERTDPVATVIASNLIRFAENGERNPVRLRELATKFLRS